MVNEKKRFGLGKIEINLTNRWLYTLIAFFGIVLVSVGVYAVVTPIPNPGHYVSELQKCDSDGQILKMSGGTWTCGTDDGGGGGSGTSLWSLGSDNKIYYNNGFVGVGLATNPSTTFEVSSSLSPPARITRLTTGPSTIVYGLDLKSQINNLPSGAGFGAGLTFSLKSSVDDFIAAEVAGLKGSDGKGSLAFSTFDGGVRSTHMFMSNNGNVGIGTTEPSVKLEVNGDLKVTGDLFLGSGGADKPVILPVFVDSAYCAGGTLCDGADIGGYSGGNQKCFAANGNNPSVRMATAEDFKMTTERPAESGWYSLHTDFDYPGDTGSRDDCNGWTSRIDGGSEGGYYWSHLSSSAGVSNCNTEKVILCVKYK